MRSRVILLWRVAVVAAMAVIPALFGGTADAGGPTSVLVVSPQNGHAAGLYYSDPEYDKLMTVLGGDAPGGAVTAVADQQQAGYGPEYVTVTWLIHDVMIWRIDRVFLGPDPDVMWVVTQFVDLQDGTVGSVDGMLPGQTGGATAVWHRPENPAALRTLLADLHITSTGAADVGSADLARSVAASASNGTGNSSGGAGSVWWAALAGLGVGVVAAIVALRALPGWQRRVLAPSNPTDVLPTMVRG